MGEGAVIKVFGSPAEGWGYVARSADGFHHAVAASPCWAPYCALWNAEAALVKAGVSGVARVVGPLGAASVELGHVPVFGSIEWR